MCCRTLRARSSMPYTSKRNGKCFPSIYSFSVVVCLALARSLASINTHLNIMSANWIRRVVASRSATSGAPTAAKFEIETYACALCSASLPIAPAQRVEIDSATAKIRWQLSLSNIFCIPCKCCFAWLEGVLKCEQTDVRAPLKRSCLLATYKSDLSKVEQKFHINYKRIFGMSAGYIAVEHSLSRFYFWFSANLLQIVVKFEACATVSSTLD